MAKDGEEALRLASERAPDVILMDIVMPGINGYQATRQLAQNPSTASIPIVIVSTKTQEADRIWGLRQGAVSYLTKPVSDADLVAAVRDALNREQPLMVAATQGSLRALREHPVRSPAGDRAPQPGRRRRRPR